MEGFEEKLKMLEGDRINRQKKLGVIGDFYDKNREMLFKVQKKLILLEKEKVKFRESYAIITK